MAPLLVGHYFLKECAENSWRDTRPIEMCTTEKCIALVGVELGKLQLLRKKLAIHVRKRRECFVEIALSVLDWGIENAKKVVELCAEVRAVPLSAVLDVQFKGCGLEDTCVLGEKAKEHAHQQAFEIVTCVTSRPQCVVKRGHQGDRLKVRGILLSETMKFIPRDKREG